MRHIIVPTLVFACVGMAFGEDDLKYKDKIFEWADDEHTQPKGEPKEVEIIGETFAKVKFKIGAGATSDVDRDDVARIVYAQGEDLEKGKRAMDGDPQGAAGMFEQLAKAAASGSRRKIFEQHALWYQAVCLHNAGDLQNAAAKYAEVISKYPDTIYLYGAAEKGVDCYLAIGNADGAKKALGNLKGVNVEDGGRFAAMRDYLTAVVEEKTNPSGAKAQYDKVEKAASRFPELQAKAKIGGGRCAIAAKDLGGAERKFRDVVDSGQKGAVLLAAWNGIGDVNFAKADDEKNPANKLPLLKTALMAYLRSAVQYDPLEGESWEEKAKGMAKAGHCFDQYADNATEAATKSLYKDRARGLYMDCVGQFGSGGGWGGWAAKRIK